MKVNLLAEISRSFLKQKRVYRYRMKIVAEMSDAEVISCCHSFCEDHLLTEEWNQFRDSIEKEYCYCTYAGQYIEPGYCYDLQMVASGYIKRAVSPEPDICITQLQKCCEDCMYTLI